MPKSMPKSKANQKLVIAGVLVLLIAASMLLICGPNCCFNCGSSPTGAATSGQKAGGVYEYFYNATGSATAEGGAGVQAPINPCNNNGVCNAGETYSNCPNDCKCGNGICELMYGETYSNCMVDCHCGSGICESAYGETPSNCFVDCHCGNGICDTGEDAGNCPQDCVVNSPPVIDSVAISPSSPGDNDNLTAVVIAHDINSDPITYAYNWYKNGAPNATTLITNGLIAYYPLNNDTKDYWGSNDGTNHGATPAVGKIGGAYTTAYTTDIEITSISTPTAYTVSMWVKFPLPTAPDNYNTLISAIGGGTHHIIVDPSKWIGVYNGGFFSSGYNVGSLTDWHLVTSVASGSTTIFYIDGATVGTSNTKVTTSSLGAIGNYVYGSNGRQQTGTLDEVMIFDRALTAAEIQKLYYGSKYGGNKMGADRTTTGDIWKLGVKGGDYTAWSSERNSTNTVTILPPNPSPTVNPFTLTTTNPAINDTNQNLTATVTATDPNGDPITYAYNWYNLQTVNISPKLWNTLGSDAEVGDSEVGPNGVRSGGSFVAGKYGNAYYGNSNGQYVRFDSISDMIDLTEPFTIETWWKPDYAADAVVCAVGVPVTLGRNIDSNFLGALQYRWQSPSCPLGQFEFITSENDGQPHGYVFTRSTGFSWSAGQWVHLGLVFDPDNGVLDLYVDGQKLTATGYYYYAPSHPYVFKAGSNPPIAMGWSGSSSPCMHGLFGAVDNIKVWDYAKTNFSSESNESRHVLNATTLITNGLVGYWPLNNDTKDYWGTNDGTAQNHAKLNSSGTVGGAYQFDGGDDSVLVSDSSSLDITGPITISVWFKKRGSGGLHPGLVSKFYYETGNYRTYGMNLDSGIYPNVLLCDQANSNCIQVKATSGISTNVWYHAVGTYNGSEVRLYLNGALNNKASYSASIGTNNLPLEIGSYDGIYKLNGLVDEVMIFNRALTASEIQKLYYGSKYGGNKMGADRTTVGDVWKLGAKAADYVGWSSERNSTNTVTILSSILSSNSAPTVNPFTLTTTNPATNDTNQNLTATVTATDPNSDPITYAYNWYKGGSLNATTLITNGLVAYLPLNNDTKDYWGTNDGTAYNGVSRISNGEVGGAYSFDGTNDYITTPVSYTTQQDFTASAWVNSNGPGVFPVVLSMGDSWAIHMGFDTGNTPSFAVAWVYIIPGPQLTPGTWHMLTGMYKDAPYGGNITFYVDGQFAGTMTVPNGLGSSGGFTWTIGRPGFYDGYYFSGKIDEVMIFNRALTTAEVQKLYYGSKHGGMVMGSDRTTAGDLWKLGAKAADYANWSNERNSTNTVTILALCGNGIVESGEQCDSNDACCNQVTCMFKSSSVECRASAGACDLAETCTGASATCPGDAKSTAECRSSAGVCDVAESCDGSNNNCPADAYKSGTTCRASTGDCDLEETCPGTGPNCPSDAKSTLECRSSAGMCDLAESCDGAGNNCPADSKSIAQCRASAGVCDVAESCDGSGNDCPSDAKSTSECRASAGVCDLVESCDGVGNNCPADAKSTAECRAAAGVCDITESCDGVNDDCPLDSKSTAECRASQDICDVADSCDGASDDCPEDAFQPSTTICQAGQGACDLTEFCTGADAACPLDLKFAGVCRAAAGVCDVLESCDGVNNDCPADGFKPSSEECRAKDDVCDIAENCPGDGVNCPLDSLEPSSTECRAAASGCDSPESCTGSSIYCPADAMIDADNDSYDACPGNDCDDSDADVYPGATELYNGVDDDCDSHTDEGFVVGSPTSGYGVTIGGNAVTPGQKFTGVQKVIFSKDGQIVMEFYHDFDEGNLNLSEVTIEITANSILVNLHGQLLSGETKALYLTDNGFSALCVKDAEVTSISAVSSACNGADETIFTSCVGNSAGITIGGITCTDLGATIKVAGLVHSAIVGQLIVTKETGGGGASATYILTPAPSPELPAPEEPAEELTEEPAEEPVAPAEQPPSNLKPLEEIEGTLPVSGLAPTQPTLLFVLLGAAAAIVLVLFLFNRNKL